MNTMDLNGIAWVGNIYEKFETMCLEVEEAMYQDTAKYVENQVQTVGASVKKFYSDVIQDLLPPSSADPLKVAAADLSLNVYADVGILKKPKARSINKDNINFDKLLTEDLKGIAGVEEDRKSSFKELHNLNHVQTSYSGGSVKGPCSELYSGKIKDGEMYKRSNECIKRISRKDNFPPSSKKSSSNNLLSKDLSRASSICGISDKHELVGDQIALIAPRASIEVIGCGSSQEGKIRDDIMDANVSIDDASVEPPTSDIILSVDSIGKKVRKSRCVSSTGVLPAESIDTCTNSGLVSQIVTLGDTQNSQSAGEEVFMSRTGSSGDCNTDVNENNDTTEQRRETIEQDDNFELEETCVWVDGEKLCFVPDSQGKHRSYKKKIRKAFSLKMGSARKQEYEQLAAQCGDTTGTGSRSKNGESVMTTLTSDSNTNKLPTHDICESEWELL